MKSNLDEEIFDVFLLRSSDKSKSMSLFNKIENLSHLCRVNDNDGTGDRHDLSFR